MTDRRATAVDLALIVGFLVAHFTFHRFFNRWIVAPDLLVGALLLAALRLRAGYAAFLGFGLGILEAVMSLEGLGTISIGLTVVGYLAARSRDLLFADTRYYIAIYLFLGTWLAELGLMLALPGGGGVLTAFVLAPLRAASTAVICGLAESIAAAVRRW